MRWALLLFAVLVIISCSEATGNVDGTTDTSTSAAGPEEDAGDAALTLEVEIEDDEDVPELDEVPPDPEFVELTATGPLDGEFSTFPACGSRDGPGGLHLHVFFAYFDESRDEIPSVDVEMRFRPSEFEGPFEFTSDATRGGDLEVEFRHGDFSYSEDLTASVSGVVSRTESESGLPLAVISFNGTFEGEIGSGGFEGEMSCIALPD